MKFTKDNLPENSKAFKIYDWNKIKNIKSRSFGDNKNDYDKIVHTGWRMIKTCIEKGGIGLAGPQVGIFKKIILCQEIDPESKQIKFKPEYTLIINPSFEAKDKAKTVELEYCLSVPGRGFEIERYNNIILTYYDILTDGTLQKVNVEKKDFASRILQHEIDHLNGTSIPQRWEYQNRKK